MKFARQAALLGAALLTPAWVYAQTAPSAAPADTKPAASTEADKDSEDITILSPFTVSSTKDSDSYTVKDTLAGTRVRTKLSDLGMAISVVNSKLMSDISANNATSLLQYTTNTEVGGMRGNYGGMGNGATISEESRLLQPDTFTRIRGLAAADNTRNYFLSSIPWDSFNVDRVDMSRGANSMLFGVGSPAGIINTSVNDAMFENQTKIQNRFGEYGSLRNLVDINYVILPKELALRVVGLDDNEQYEQEGTFNHQKRVYGALKYAPKWLDFPGAHTEIKINEENGSVISRNPRVLPPVDKITPWFTGLNQLTVNPYIAHQNNNPIMDKSGATGPYLQTIMGRMDWSNMTYTFGSPNSPTASILESHDVNYGTPYAIGQPNGAGGALPTSTSWPVTGALQGILYAQPIGISPYSQYAKDAGLVGSQYGAFKDKLLTDPKIFDFYKYTLDGPNTHQYQNWNGFNAELSQTFLDNRIGFDVAYYAESYRYGGEDYLSGSSYAISVDINSVTPKYITNANDTNPNVGRPYISTDGVYGNGETRIQRNAYRATLYGDIRSSDFISSELGREILGNHVLTAVASKDSIAQTEMSWARWDTALGGWAGDTNGSAVGGTSSLNGGSRNVDMVTYIGPSLLGAANAAGHNLSGLTVVQQPGTSAMATYFDSHWKSSLNPTDPAFINPNTAYTLPVASAKYGTTAGDTALNGNASENPANYKGWTTSNFQILNADAGNKGQLYFSGDKIRNVVKSDAFTWQGHLFDETLVTAFGWRKDKVSEAGASAPTIGADGLVDPTNYTVGSPISEERQSRTWSLVYKLPKSIKKYLPKGMDFNVFFDKSSNFQAQGIRFDYLGNQISDPTGDTKEYGFVVSAFDGKLSFKADWYDSKEQNATYAGGVLGTAPWELYLLPTWAAATASECYAGLTNQTLYGTSVQNVNWFWDYAAHNGSITTGGQQPRPTAGQPGYADDQAEFAMIKAFADNSLPQSFYDVYQMPISVANMQSGDWLHAITQANWYAAGGVGGLQSASGGKVHGNSPTITLDTGSKGVEFELYAQPIHNWNITVNASKDTSTEQNVAKPLVQLINMEKTLWDSAAGDLHLWWAGGSKMRDVFNQDIYGPYLNFLAQQGTQVAELHPWRANAITSYTFDTGIVKGVTVGGALRWEQGAILGYDLDRRQTLPDGSVNPKYALIDVNKPYKGPSDQSFDLWVGYERKLAHNLTWQIQLNLHNVGQKDRLVAISVEPDGTGAEYRIVNGQTWELTNTFKF